MTGSSTLGGPFSTKPIDYGRKGNRYIIAPENAWLFQDDPADPFVGLRSG